MAYIPGVTSVATDSGSIRPSTLGVLSILGTGGTGGGGAGIIASATGSTVSLKMNSPFNSAVPFAFTQTQNNCYLQVAATTNNPSTTSSILIQTPTSSGSSHQSIQFVTADNSGGYGIFSHTELGSQPLIITYFTPGATPDYDVWNMSLEGIRTMPRQPIFSVDLSSNQANVTGDGTVYLIPFDSVNLNQGSYFSAVSHQFTAPKAGNYFFTAGGSVIPGTVGASTEFFLTLYVNGVEFSRLAEGKPQPGASGTFYFTGTDVFSLAAGDLVDCRVKFSGTTKTVGMLGTGNALACTFNGFLFC